MDRLMKLKKRTYPLDNSGIIHLAALRPWHSNLFRISATLNEPVRPELLQQAVCVVTPRFPTLVAGIQGGALEYQVVPVDEAPGIRPDSCLLAYMRLEEIEKCAMRVLYGREQVCVEFFHSLTDGYGGFEFIKALLAEYLKLAHGVDCLEGEDVLLPGQLVGEEETADSFLAYAEDKKAAFHRVHSYLPHEGTEKSRMRTISSTFEAGALLAAAHRYRVSLTTFLTAVMADTIMELQVRSQSPGSPFKPVRIMVPVDLRRKFHSKTLRNFSLYALVGLWPEERTLSFEERVRRVDEQLREQFTKEHLAAMITTNAAMARNFILRHLPLGVKRAGLGIGFRLMGESASCLTLSNMGQVLFPERMKPYIREIGTFLTPRIRSPHNCGIASYDGRLYINFTRSCPEPELELIFIQKLWEMGCVPALKIDGRPTDVREFLS